MAVVVDASVAAAWCLRDEQGSPQADVVMDLLSDEPGVVPGIFWHEIRNVLIVAERRGRIDPDVAEQHVNRLRILPLVTDHDQDDARTLALARRHALSSYDAAYIATAQRHGATIATLDAKLATAAAAEGSRQLCPRTECSKC